MEPTRRELRQQKREIKRAGGKRRRRAARQLLAENPEEAASIGADFDFGSLSTARLNGTDRDPTRRGAGRENGRDPFASSLGNSDDDPRSNTA